VNEELEHWHDRAVAAEAEAERLREENTELRSNVEAWMASHGKAVAEVGRLRAICGECANGRCQYHEVERLRTDLAEANERVTAYENWDGTKRDEVE